MLGHLIRQSKAWKAERERAQEEAKVRMSEAKTGNANAAKTTEPQIVAHLNSEQPRSDSGKVASRVSPHIVAEPGNRPLKRDAAQKNERKASTALAAQIGTNRGRAAGTMSPLQGVADSADDDGRQAINHPPGPVGAFSSWVIASADLSQRQPPP